MAVIRRPKRTTVSMSRYSGRSIPLKYLLLLIAACAFAGLYIHQSAHGSHRQDDEISLSGLVVEEIQTTTGDGPPTSTNRSNAPDITELESTASSQGTTTEGTTSISSSVSKPETPGLAIVMFAHLKNTDRFDNLIFPALDTWWDVNETEPLYIVLTPQWKENYATMCQNHVEYCSRLYPLWVDCPEGQFGESPCCKQEKGLLALPKAYEWTLFADDDMYFKVDHLRGLLQNHLPDASTSVYLVTAGGRSAKQLGQFGYKGIRGAYKCSDLPEYRYPWGQPVIYSRAALRRVTPGLRAGGLVKQCIEFDVTHDAGNSIFHWMYQLPDYAIRISMFPGTKVSRDVMGVHGIHRYIESVGHVVTMKEVHAQATNSSQKTSYKKYMKFLNNRTGFLESETLAKYGDPRGWGDDVWHTMPVTDCMDNEMRSKLAR
jgi:hypothetical protein